MSTVSFFARFWNYVPLERFPLTYDLVALSL